jgi:sugar phosphate isomerase/epimerase
MIQTVHRRSFLKSSGAAATAALVAGRLPIAAAAPAESATPNADRLGWQLCCQTYTFRRFGLYESLGKIAALGFRAVEPCFFLKLREDRPELKTSETLSAEARAELKSKLAEYGIRMVNFYSNLDRNEAECRRKFDFAREMGVETIVSEPPAEAFDVIESLCDEYKINLAVHNHPRHDNYNYWNPEGVLAVLKGRGKRIGGCCDTGHWVRSGLDPVECLKKMEGRIVSLHLKDVAEWGKPEARDVPLGTGKADYAAVLREIRRQKFRGVMAVEYEHDSDKLMDELAECIAFVEKTAATL